MSSARVETSPQDFREILIVPDEQGNPPLVIGGQAVNLWANYYLQKEPELQQLGPFVSKDLDLLGDQQTVWRLAALLGQRPQRPPEEQQALFSPVLIFAHLVGNPPSWRYFSQSMELTQEKSWRARP